MCPRWNALHDALLRSLNGAREKREWCRLAVRHLALAAHPTAAAALAALQPGEVSLEELERKNEILRALVLFVQAGGPPAAAANPVLWLALWHGLGRLVRLHGRFVHDPDEAVSEVTDRFALVVHRLRIDHVARVAVTLLRSTQRELQELRRARGRQREHERPVAELPGAGRDEIGLLELRLVLEKGGSDSTVAMLHGLLAGMTTPEVAQVVGMATSTVQKQTNRALRRLGRRIFSENARGDVRFFRAEPHVDSCGDEARGRSDMPDLKIDSPQSDARFYDEYLRLPGVFRRWELEQIVDLDCEYRFEDAGMALDGSRLITVYRRELKSEVAAQARGRR